MASVASRAECVHLTQGAVTPLPRVWAVLVLTGSFMVLEVVGGWLSGSLALLADAGHMLTDVGALALSLLTAWIAQRPADANKTYGYLRWEILAALVNGAALFGIAGWVVLEAIERIQHPGPIRSGLFLAIATAGLVVNLVSLALLHGARHGSLNARGAYLHVLSDALGSVGALTAAAIIWLTGLTVADPIASVVLSLLILLGAWRLLRESTDILLDAVPRHVAMPPPAPASAGFSSFRWTTTHSVVRSNPAIDAAFWSAVRVTLVGSMTPAFTRSSNVSVSAL